MALYNTISKRILLILCMMFPGLPAFAQGTEPIWFVISDSSNPPSDSAEWKQVTLPDNWNISNPDFGGNGWYRIHKHLDKNATDAWAILIDRVGMNAAVFVDNQLLGSGGTFEEPVSRNWARPLMFVIPKSLLHAGDNAIYIRFFSYANDSGGLHHYVLEPATSIIKKYEGQHSYFIISSYVIFYIEIIFAILLLILWLTDKKHSEYLWLSAIGWMGSVFSANMMVRDIPVSRDTWELGVQISIGWMIWFMMLFSHRFLKVRSPRLEQFVALYAVAGAVALIFVPEKDIIAVASTWQTPFMILATYIFILAVTRYWRSRTLDHLSWAIAYTLLYFSGIYDWAQVQLLNGSDFNIIFHFGTMGFVLVTSLILLNRYVQAMHNIEQLNSRLLGKIDRVIAEKQQEEAITNERSRIMRDLHDGVGNSLVSALAQSMSARKDTHDLQYTLKDAIAEMRLIISATSNSDSDFTQMLPLIRERSAKMLENHQITLDWHESPLPEPATMTIEHRMHLIRIIQEAITNVAKHAGASRVQVFISYDQDSLNLTISDNGHGIQQQSSGHGLENMKFRAEQMQAELTVQTSSSGTSITLNLPFEVA